MPPVGVSTGAFVAPSGAGVVGEALSLLRAIPGAMEFPPLVVFGPVLPGEPLAGVCTGALVAPCGAGVVVCAQAMPAVMRNAAEAIIILRIGCFLPFKALAKPGETL